MELAMDITTDGDGSVDRLDIWFLNQNLFHLYLLNSKSVYCVITKMYTSKKAIITVFYKRVDMRASVSELKEVYNISIKSWTHIN